MSEPVTVKRQVTIAQPADKLYAFWRSFENLPRFMHYLEAVRTLDERRSHWMAKAPLGQSVEWDAEITADTPNELIAWRALPKAQVNNWGSVRFYAAPGDRGTVVQVELSYEPPAGKVGDLVAKLFGAAPDQQVREDLRRFKALMEAGEIPTIENQPHGERTLLDKVAGALKPSK